MLMVVEIVMQTKDGQGDNGDGEVDHTTVEEASLPVNIHYSCHFKENIKPHEEIFKGENKLIQVEC